MRGGTMKLMSVLTLSALIAAGAVAQDKPTFAERLGWPAEARVVIFHSDDAGMSHSSNVGTIESVENGLVTSASTMMPCGWVPEFAHWLAQNPDFDNGLHLTLTSEWKKYRWAPVAGAAAVPSLVDKEGCLWPGVFDVVAKGSADDVETEIRAQIQRAEDMGMPITHLDSHMGTLFASPAFFERYIKVGIEKQIPVLIMGGHMTHISQRNPGASRALGGPEMIERIWDAGLPVIDDLHTGVPGNTKEEVVKNMVAMLKELKPGITEVIVHATRPTAEFSQITGSGPRREAELEAMLSEEVRRCIEEEGIILTTWRELKERRDKVGSAG
jgi:chitin disaccharide deacetylase